MLFVIPSYQRADILISKTLRLLEKMDILNTNYHRVIVYTANENEKKEYLSKLLNKYSNLEVEVGELGIMKQRNIMNQLSKSSNCIVSLDDDLDNLYITNDRVQRPLHKKEFHQLLTFMSKVLCNSNSNIIGLSMNTNTFYHSKKLSSTLAIIPAGFYMIKKYYPNTIQNDAIEDIERSLNYFIEDGIIVRIMNVSFHRKDFNKKNAGGIQALYNNEERNELIEKGYEELKNKYPKFISGISKNLIKLKKFRSKYDINNLNKQYRNLFFLEI